MTEEETTGTTDATDTTDTAGASGNGKPFNDEDNVHLVLAYLGIFSLIPFLMFRDKRSDPQKEYVYWHARQGLALEIVKIAVSLVLFIPFAIVTFGVGVPCFALLWFILWLVPSIIGWVKAFGGEKWDMPVVSKLAEIFN